MIVTIIIILNVHTFKYMTIKDSEFEFVDLLQEMIPDFLLLTSNLIVGPKVLNIVVWNFIAKINFID